MTHDEPMDLDSLLRHIHKLLPNPIREEQQLDGMIVLVGGDPGEVVVRIGDTRVSIAVFAVRWEGPHTPVVRPIQLAALNWKRFPESRLFMQLHSLIDTARELRRAKYRKCERCGETKPPEWMHDANTCQSCAERDLGVVY
jgi:hypothetical protein